MRARPQLSYYTYLACGGEQRLGKSYFAAARWPNRGGTAHERSNSKVGAGPHSIWQTVRPLAPIQRQACGALCNFLKRLIAILLRWQKVDRIHFDGCWPCHYHSPICCCRFRKCKSTRAFAGCWIRSASSIATIKPARILARIVINSCRACATAAIISGGPARSTSPRSPCGPCGPCGPVAPVSPRSPFGPAGPCVPSIPCTGGPANRLSRGRNRPSAAATH